MSGVMTIPMIVGLFVVVHRHRPDHHQHRAVEGASWSPAALLVTAGFGLLGRSATTPRTGTLAIYMALLGLGIGMTMQNLVLAVQNQVAAADLGAASSLVTFFRSLGGAIGVSALGAVLGNRVTHYVTDGLAALHVKGGAGDGGGIPDLATLPAPVRAVVESAYGHGVGDVFLYAAPLRAAGLPARTLRQGSCVAQPKRFAAGCGGYFPVGGG